MKLHRGRAAIIGALFIAAAVFSILGYVLGGTTVTDPAYVLDGPTNENRVVAGAYLELLAAVTVAGTGVAFFPVLRKFDDSFAIGYAGGRVIEAVLILVGTISVLTLLSLRQAVAGGAALDGPALETASHVLRSVHELALILGPNFMLGFNTALVAYVVYRTRIVPQPIAILGLIGAVLISGAAGLEVFGIIEQFSTTGALLALPVFAWEMSLAVWLIVKGFTVPGTILESDGEQSSVASPALD